jgi:predicted TIM-barrel fold metal-dependent hydrolase
MFNPLRPGSLELCQYAVKKLGFIGIKLYPAMGFNPDFTLNGNDARGNKNKYINKQLESFYQWASAMKLPITVHTQYTSMQRIGYRDSEVAKYTSVENWINVLHKLKPFNFRINFAHFGGLEFLDTQKSPAKKFSMECRNGILKLMETYNVKRIKIYTDVAAHALSELNQKQKKAYREQFVEHLNKHPGTLMFGTDTPAISYMTSDHKYIDEFIALFHDTYSHGNGTGSVSKHLDAFFFKNARIFLFGASSGYPAYYKNFLKGGHY